MIVLKGAYLMLIVIAFCTVVNCLALPELPFMTFAMIIQIECSALVTASLLTNQLGVCACDSLPLDESPATMCLLQPLS